MTPRQLRLGNRSLSRTSARGTLPALRLPKSRFEFLSLDERPAKERIS
jgi:hypothetical protein